MSLWFIQLTLVLSLPSAKSIPTLRFESRPRKAMSASLRLQWDGALPLSHSPRCMPILSVSISPHLMPRRSSLTPSAVASAGPMDLDRFADRLWGNIYYNSETRKFSRKSGPGTKRGFEHFILEPLYKLYSQVSLSYLCRDDTLSDSADDIFRCLERTLLRSSKLSVSWVSTSSPSCSRWTSDLSSVLCSVNSLDRRLDSLTWLSSISPIPYRVRRSRWVCPPFPCPDMRWLT